MKAEEIISWTEEAEARMERVPPQVKGVARTALLRYAIEQGHTVITNKVIDEAMAIFMPTRMAEKMQILAEDLAVAQLRKDSQAATAICSICGYTVKGPQAVVTCPVCSAVRRQVPGDHARGRRGDRGPGGRHRGRRVDAGRAGEVVGRRARRAARGRGRLPAPARQGARREVRALEEDPGHHVPARAADDRGDGRPRQAGRRLGHAAGQDQVRARHGARRHRRRRPARSRGPRTRPLGSTACPPASCAT